MMFICSEDYRETCQSIRAMQCNAVTNVTIGCGYSRNGIAMACDYVFPAAREEGQKLRGSN